MDITISIILVILTAGLTYAVSLFFNRSQQTKLTIKLRQVEQELDQTQTELRKRTQAFNEELSAKSESIAAELLKLREQHRNALDERDDAYRAALRKLDEESFQAGARQKELHYETLGAGLQVVVHPYIRKTKGSNLIWESTTCEVGYQYQLMVQGIPCLVPHIQIISSESYDVVNNERLGMLITAATEAARLAASIKNPAILLDTQPIITEAKS